MSEAFTIVIFVVLMFLFLILAYGSGALDAYLKGYKIYVENLDRQLMASDTHSEDLDPDELLHSSWRGPSGRQTQFLHGCQGAKQRRRHSTQNID